MPVAAPADQVAQVPPGKGGQNVVKGQRTSPDEEGATQGGPTIY